MNGHQHGRPPFPHHAYERLSERCGGVRGHNRPHTPRGRQTDPGPARPDVCERCDALRVCCYCDAPVADLRVFARRMAELHDATGTPVCGCGVHGCYVRRRLDGITRQDRP